MAYGFKLTGVTIPDGTTAINVVISDGTTPTEYALTGSVADGFSGTGISATCTADDDVYDVDITVDAYTSEDVGDEYTIKLSTGEAPTQAFKNALNLVDNEKTLEISQSSYPTMLHTLATKIQSIVDAEAGEIVNLDDTVSETLSAELTDFVEKASAGTNVKIIAPFLEGQNVILSGKIETYQTDVTNNPIKLCSFRITFKHLFIGLSGIVEVGCGFADLYKYTSLMTKPSPNP